MDNPEKLAKHGTQDEEKQNKNTTQYVLDITIKAFMGLGILIRILVVKIVYTCELEYSTKTFILVQSRPLFPYYVLRWSCGQSYI